MHNESLADRPEVLDPPKRGPSFAERWAGPAVFAGLFIVWPAANLATAVIGYKTLCKKVELEELQQAAAQITKS